MGHGNRGDLAMFGPPSLVVERLVGKYYNHAGKSSTNISKGTIIT